MAEFQTLAERLLDGVPITKLQTMLERSPELTFGGGICGCGCSGGDGVSCGFWCRPQASAPHVIDVEGRLGLSADDLADIRNDLPKLRQAVLDRIEGHLNQLRPR